MDIIFWVFAGLGMILATYWLASVLIGMFGDRTRVGRHYLVKRLRLHGINPSQLSDHQLNRIAFNAYSVCSYGGRQGEVFSNDRFLNELEYRAELVSQFLKGVPLDSDTQALAELLLNPEPFPSNNMVHHSASSS